MSEHIAGTYKHLGCAEEDYEWDNNKHFVLEHLDLTEYDFEGLVEVCREQGIGTE